MDNAVIAINMKIKSDASHAQRMEKVQHANNARKVID